jgi:hypothetical protein
MKFIVSFTDVFVIRVVNARTNGKLLDDLHRAR